MMKARRRQKKLPICIHTLPCAYVHDGAYAVCYVILSRPQLLSCTALHAGERSQLAPSFSPHLPPSLVPLSLFVMSFLLQN